MGHLQGRIHDFIFMMRTDARQALENLIFSHPSSHSLN